MLRGEKVTLSPLRKEEVEDFIFLLEREAFKCSGFFNKFKPRHLLVKEFEESGFWMETRGMMAIFDKRKNIIGAVSFKRCEGYSCLDVRYVIFEKEDMQKGYAKEALRLFSRYLFSKREVNRLQVTICDYNRASMAVAQSCGYKFEGIARGAFFNKGRYIDLCVYAILREECEGIESLYERRDNDI